MAKRKIGRIIGDIIKLTIVAAIIGGVLFYFFGDHFKQIKAVKDVDISELYTVNESDQKLQGPIKDDLKLPAPGKPGYYWRVYFKHLPESRKEPDKDKLRFVATFKRKINKSERSDAGGTSHHYTPGDLALDLRIKKQSFDKTIYKERYARELKPIIVREAGEGISESRKREAFEDEETKIIKHELPTYLSIAAIVLMEDEGDLDDEYLPTVADACAHSEKKISTAAVKALLDMRPRDIDAIKEARMILAKRMPGIKEDEVKKNARRAQKYLEKRLEKAKRRADDDDKDGEDKEEKSGEEAKESKEEKDAGE